MWNYWLYRTLDSKKILLNGLSQLECRGCDSTRLLYLHENSHICLVRRTGGGGKLKGDVDNTDVSTA